MSRTIIKNAMLVNEGQIIETDIAIAQQRIAQISAEITPKGDDKVIDAHEKLILPGMIDDQVHFREPGMTHKGNIASESRAAAAGGITSYMEMPNVKPSTTTVDALRKKHELANAKSFGNYSFYLGATPDNLAQIKSIDPSWVCGVKVFMGASTGDLLVDHPDALEAIFRECPTLIATHCENGDVIAKNQQRLQQEQRELTIHDHPILRDAEACYASSSYAVALAKKYRTQLNVLHITTAKEIELFDVGPVANKHITAEACAHHLWFNQNDYTLLGNQIKCNPAIKPESDRLAILQAIRDGRIDIIATDHAPHTWDEKQQPFMSAPAGLPLVEHALLSVLEQTNRNELSLVQVVEKTAHNPAIRYGVEERGFVREGYFADLVMVDPQAKTAVTQDNTRYLCQWTPFAGTTFNHRIAATWINGRLGFDGEQIIEAEPSSEEKAVYALQFSK